MSVLEARALRKAAWGHQKVRENDSQNVRLDAIERGKREVSKFSREKG